MRFFKIYYELQWVRPTSRATVSTKFLNAKRMKIILLHFLSYVDIILICQFGELWRNYRTLSVDTTLILVSSSCTLDSFQLGIHS